MFSDHKFAFECQCKNEFFITADNLAKGSTIVCPNCKYSLPKIETEKVISAAKAVCEIDEMNERASTIFSSFDDKQDELKMRIIITAKDYSPLQLKKHTD